MKLVNTEINNATLYKSPEFQMKEKIREIICDKYGMEGDSELDEMIEEIVSAVMEMEVN